MRHDFVATQHERARTCEHRPNAKARCWQPPENLSSHSVLPTPYITRACRLFLCTVWRLLLAGVCISSSTFLLQLFLWADMQVHIFDCKNFKDKCHPSRESTNWAAALLISRLLSL